MKLTIQQPDLYAGLARVVKAVSSRSTLPVLANVLVDATGDRLKLAATNLEMGLAAWVEAEIQEPGAVTVPAKTFLELVSTLSGAITLDLNQRTQTVGVNVNGAKFTLKGIDAGEFPPFPDPDTEPDARLDPIRFAELVGQVEFAASEDESRPILKGVHFDLVERSLKLYAADGFRLSIVKTPIEQPATKPLKFTIPAAAVSEYSKLANPSEPIQMIVPPGRGQVIFRQSNLQFVSQMIEGTYPDLDQLVPRDSTTTATLPISPLARAARQVKIYAREGNWIIALTFADGSVKATGQAAETGDGDISIDGARLEGPGLTVGLNVKFLDDYLSVARSPEIKFEMTSGVSPVKLTGAGQDGYTHVIMPMNINGK